MAKKLKGFIWILFFAVIAAAFYGGFLIGYNQGRGDAIAAEDDGEPPAAVRTETGVTGTEAEVDENGIGQIELSVEEPQHELEAGGSFEASLVLRNSGSAPVREIRFRIDLPGSEWKTTIPEIDIETLEPDQELSARLSFTAPADAMPGEYQIMVKVVARSREREIESEAVQLEVTLTESC